MEKEPVEAIVFDFGNVIINIDLERMYENFATFSHKPVSLIKKRFAEFQLFRRYETGLFSEDEFCEVVRQSIGFPFNDGEIIDIWNSLLLDVPNERIELIYRLRERYPVYLLSNTNVTHINECNRRFKELFSLNSVRDLFDYAYYSFEIGLYKPEEAIYRYLLNDIDVPPEKTLFFDDNEANIDAARAVGIQSVLITNTFGITDYF